MRRYARVVLGYVTEARPPSASEIAEAWKILGLEPGDQAKIKAAYKALARKYHPDANGGSDENMKRLNWANDVLDAAPDGGAKPGYDRDWWKAREAESLAKNEAKVSEMKGLIDSAPFLKHLSKFFEGLVESPIDAHAGSNFGNIKKSWSTADGKTVFKLEVTVHSDRGDEGALGSGKGPSYSVSYTTQVYHAGRTYKMKNRSYAWAREAGEVLEPDTVFPATALKRVFSKSRAGGKVQRRDVEAMIKNEFGGVFRGGDGFMQVPMPDGRTISLQRTVMMRTAAWSFRHVLGPVAASTGGRNVVSFDFHYIPETDEGVAAISDALKRLLGGEDPGTVGRELKAKKWTEA